MSAATRHSPPPSSQAPRPKGILKNSLERRPSQPEDVNAIAHEGEGSASTGGAAGHLHINTNTDQSHTNGLQWDESNIALHDFEKQSTQRMKIDEPKTPFVRGSGVADDGFDAFSLDSPASTSSSAAFPSAPGGPSAGSSSDADQLAANTSANAQLGGGRPGAPRNHSNSAIGLDSADLIASQSQSSTTASEAAPRLSARSQSRSPSFSLPSSGSGASSRRASQRSMNGDESRSAVRRENAMDVDGSGQEEAVGVDEELEEEDEETRAQREAFAKKRNAHYGNEAEALRVAKALAAKDNEEEEEEDVKEASQSQPNGV